MEFCVYKEYSLNRTAISNNNKKKRNQLPTSLLCKCLCFILPNMAIMWASLRSLKLGCERSALPFFLFSSVACLFGCLLACVCVGLFVSLSISCLPACLTGCSVGRVATWFAFNVFKCILLLKVTRRCREGCTENEGGSAVL